MEVVAPRCWKKNRDVGSLAAEYLAKVSEMVEDDLVLDRCDVVEHLSYWSVFDVSIDDLKHLYFQYYSYSPVQERLEGNKTGLLEAPASTPPQKKGAGYGLEHHILLICVHLVVVPYLGHGNHQGVRGG